MFRRLIRGAPSVFALITSGRTASPVVLIDVEGTFGVCQGKPVQRIRRNGAATITPRRGRQGTTGPLARASTPQGSRDTWPQLCDRLPTRSSMLSHPSRCLWSPRYNNLLMSAISRRPAQRVGRRLPRPRAGDPRVVRSRAAVVEAARALFLRKGYAGTTMEGSRRWLASQRTVSNNFPDKPTLFTQIVMEVIAYAEEFARGLHEEFTARVTAASLQPTLEDLGLRLALAIMRPEVVALRRLSIGESREFPALGAKYFNRAPGQVLEALASGFDRLDRSGCCGWPTPASPPHSSRISWRVSRSTAPCLSGRHRQRSTSSPARGKGCRRSCSIRGHPRRPREKGMRRRTVAIGRGPAASVVRRGLPSRCSAIRVAMGWGVKISQHLLARSC